MTDISKRIAIIAAELEQMKLMEKFRAAAILSVHPKMDLTLLGDVDFAKVLPNISSSAVLLDPYMQGADRTFILEFNSDGRHIGAITANVKVEHGKIQFYNMQYDTQVKGLAPYAMRQLFTILRDVKEVVISTGVMGIIDHSSHLSDQDQKAVEQRELIKLRRFHGIGFQLVDEVTKERLPVPADVHAMVPCRAVFPFNDQATRDAVFEKMRMPSDASAASAASAVTRADVSVPAGNAPQGSSGPPI